MFENSDFVYMLNQAAGGRAILAKQLNISPHQLSYVTGSGVGEGLLFYGSDILPFVDKFPQSTELYSIMTTRLIDDEDEDEYKPAGERETLLLLATRLLVAIGDTHRFNVYRRLHPPAGTAGAYHLRKVSALCV